MGDDRVYAKAKNCPLSPDNLYTVILILQADETWSRRLVLASIRSAYASKRYEIWPILLVVLLVVLFIAFNLYRRHESCLFIPSYRSVWFYPTLISIQFSLVLSSAQTYEGRTEDAHYPLTRERTNEREFQESRASVADFVFGKAFLLARKRHDGRGRIARDRNDRKLRSTHADQGEGL